MSAFDWDLISAFATAMKNANTPRTLPRAIALALAPQWDVESVRLVLIDGGQMQIVEASRVGEAWASRVSVAEPKKARIAEAAKVSDRGRSLVLPLRAGETSGELCLRLGGGQPVLGDEAYLKTLAHVLEVGIEFQRLVQRVADLSRRAHDENRALRESLDKSAAPTTLVARSAKMRSVIDKIDLVAGFETSVLIRGESGVGKELVAHSIHRRSRRSRRPFLQVNCGAIPAALIESELFGHERGAFTGAERQHRGLFERAHGGVLLLDEVGELPLEMQVKLLRVLQEGRVRRVGGESEGHVDVRVLAATNRDLEAMMSRSEFRQDLFYRLNVFPIEVPPLRERPEDLVPLVASIVGRLAKKLGLGARPVVPRAVTDRLLAHSWPGNVRELANVIESAIILGRGRTLELPQEFGTRSPPQEGRGTAAVIPLRDSIRAAIESALEQTNGKIYGRGGAAAALALHPATLQSKMRKLGIQRASFVRSARPSAMG